MQEAETNPSMTASAEDNGDNGDNCDKNKVQFVSSCHGKSQNPMTYQNPSYL